MRDRHVADLLVGRKKCLDRHRIGHLAHPDQFGQHLVDLAVQRLVEMARLEEVGDAIERVIVDQNGSEQRLFGLDVVGCFAIERCLRRRELADCFSHAGSV